MADLKAGRAQSLVVFGQRNEVFLYEGPDTAATDFFCLAAYGWKHGVLGVHLNTDSPLA